MKYGLQMFSVRDLTGKDLAMALSEVAEMGYHYIEFAGFFGHSAEDVKAMLDKNGLVCSGTHSDWHWACDNFEEAVAYHKTIGAKAFIIPGADLSTRAKLDDFIEKTNKLVPMFEAEGIELAYHNHSYEFLPTAEGFIMHDELQKRSKMKFEIDTFWVWNADLCPIETLEKLKGRVSVIHLKDGIKDGEGRSLGLGDAPVKAVREYCIKNNLTMIVESEGLKPTGLSEVRRCIEFLNLCDRAEGI
ncbi:MAG: sugar phosphate isomerase/epimerase [Clostridiales bacterium]|nr:sugar phosphate isomerase/epimerase [Clostridiales bacterium]